MKKVASIVGTSAMVLTLSLGAAWAQQSTATQPTGSLPAVTDPKQAVPAATGEKPKAPVPTTAATGAPDAAGKATVQPAEVKPKAVEATTAGKSAEKATEAPKGMDKATAVKEATPAKVETAPVSKEGVKTGVKPAEDKSATAPLKAGETPPVPAAPKQ